MRKTRAITLFLLILCMIIWIPNPTLSTEQGEPTSITVECQYTNQNATGLERYRHTIIVAQLDAQVEGLTIYLNLSGAIIIHATSTTNSMGICMWEWIPENLSSVTINASYSQDIYSSTNVYIFQETDVILELEHAQKYGLNNRLYMQLFAISKIGNFEPAYAPYRIQIVQHNDTEDHQVLVEWVGFLDNHGYCGFYADLTDTVFTTIDYEIWCYIYNNTGDTSEGDVLIDSDGGATNQRAEVYEPGYYVSFYNAYGPSSNLWWYNDTDDDNNYDIESEVIEGLLWSHTIYGDITLVGWLGEDSKQLSSANNYKDIYFNDTDEDEQWSNFTQEEIAEDIWLDNGNGIWDAGEEGETPNYNGTPFLRMFHTFKVVPGTSYGKSTSITANKWTWLGYLNGTSKTGAQLYSEITNCTYLVMQNTSSGYYYTYGLGLTEDFTITYGSAVCMALSSDETWDHK